MPRFNGVGLGFLMKVPLCFFTFLSDARKKIPSDEAFLACEHALLWKMRQPHLGRFLGAEMSGLIMGGLNLAGTVFKRRGLLQAMGVSEEGGVLVEDNRDVLVLRAIHVFF